MEAEKKVILDNSGKILTFFFVILSLFWFIFNIFSQPDQIDNKKVIWASLYQVVAIYGGVWGLIVARSWGGVKSVMGRSIISFSLGLLFQALGQSVYSVYNLILNVDVPYPSVGDIGFFGSILLYVYGIILLAKSSGVKFSLHSYFKKIQSILIPAAVLLMSYWFFLRTYEFDWSDPLRIFLDFGYPLGQAIYISLAILTFILSKNFLGGLMRNKVLFILFALLVQYVADYNFLYQASQLTWNNGEYGDLIYLFSYFLMAIGISKLHITYIKMQ